VRHMLMHTYRVLDQTLHCEHLLLLCFHGAVYLRNCRLRRVFDRLLRSLHLFLARLGLCALHCTLPRVPHPALGGLRECACLLGQGLA